MLSTDKLFTSSLTLSAPTAVPAAKARLVPKEVYFPAWATTTAEHIGWMATIATHFTSVSVNESEWKTLLASYVDAALEMPEEAFPAALFEKALIPDAVKADVRQVGEVLLSFFRGNYDPVEWPQVRDLTAPIVPGFPIPEDQDVAWMPSWGDSKAMYAHFAMVVYLMGRTITDKNRESVTKNRPSALIRTFRLEDAKEALSGENQLLSKKAMEFIPLAWEALTPTRVSLVVILAESFGAATTVAVQIILLNFQLMAWHGVSYAPMVHNFLISYPWAAKEAAYVSSARHFVSSAEVLLMAGTPALLPYYRVILRQQAGLVFSRKLLSSLVGAAVHVLRRTEPSMLNYVLSTSENEAGLLFARLEARFEASKISIIPAPQITEVPHVAAAPESAKAAQVEEEVIPGVPTSRLLDALVGAEQPVETPHAPVVVASAAPREAAADARREGVEPSTPTTQQPKVAKKQSASTRVSQPPPLPNLTLGKVGPTMPAPRPV